MSEPDRQPEPTISISPILNPQNFPPPLDRSTTLPPGTTLILAADLSLRNLTPAERQGLHLGTHILITQDRVNQRYSTWDQIDHARQIVAAAITDERRKATLAAIRAERAANGTGATSQGLSSSEAKAKWRASRTPEQIAADRERDSERKRAARKAKQEPG